ncbi:hypothetical protein HYX01_02030, partial [Candidatus Woesearchaeota archaeon]|nr:hypothetical protein [Candidatus Woesearchaeota archaeon]
MAIKKLPKNFNRIMLTIVTDTKNNPLTDVKLYSNSILNGSVDADGSRTINYTDVVCGSSQSITVK